MKSRWVFAQPGSAIPLARTPWCCRRSSLVQLEENEEKRKRDGKRWGRRCAGERNGEENEKIKNNKIILKNDI
jgi:hypothetical protein